MYDKVLLFIGFAAVLYDRVIISDRWYKASGRGGGGNNRPLNLGVGNAGTVGKPMESAKKNRVVARFDGVSVRYQTGAEILHDVSLELDSDSFYFLTGPSGAGKTTLLRLLYLSLRPTRGSAVVFGHDVAKTPRAQLPALRRRIGVVFQDFRLLRHLSVFDNVALPLRIAGVREDEVRRDVVELLTWVGLKNHVSVPTPALSGGQQQLVAIARAVIGRPKLILADEPTGNVDERVAARLIHLFQELNKLGATVVIATHNHSLAQRFGYPRFNVEGGRLFSEDHAGIPSTEPGADEHVRGVAATGAA
jgi:cell division transport system ATP-binding protein